MKPFKIILTICLIFGSVKTEAQFLKQLKERVKQSSEETTIMKVEEKASEKTGEVIDKVFDNTIDKIFSGKKKKRKKGKGNKNTDEDLDSDEMIDDDIYEDGNSEATQGGGMARLQEMMKSAQNMGSADYSNLPKSYDFEWKYVMDIKIEGVEEVEEMQMTYYLQPNEDYLGMNMEMREKGTNVNMFMVVDNAREFGIMLMDVDNTKYASVVSTPTNNYDYDLYDEDLGTNFSFKEIGSKTILGYKCKGFRMEDEDSIVIMYMTTDAPVSFNKIFKASDNSAPSGFDPRWLKQAENGVILEMEFINKSMDNQTSKMYCTELTKELLTIKISDYKIMQNNFMK